MKENYIEELLLFYCEGTLSPAEREKVKKWTEASEENRQIFADSLRAWEGIEHLRRMKRYDSEKAIKKVHSKIESQKKINLLKIFQKVAAVLILPLVATTIYFAVKKAPQKEEFVAWHTLEIPAGMRSEFVLPDSSKVWLNSQTNLSYPVTFNNEIREVRLTGEAYFEVAENCVVPFVVNTGRINIEVTGTEFIASNYPHEKLTEVVLVEGEINLFQGDYLFNKKDVRKLQPGERAYLEEGETEMAVGSVNVKKYQAWKKGILMFRDDSMKEVVRRLNRWFNVDIQLTGPELEDYVYTATFEDESLMQILELLKISAPIDYTIKQRERKPDKTFSKMEIMIRQL